MSEPHGVCRVGDTVRSVPGESRDASKADFFEGPGVVSGYRQAASERPLLLVHWVDGVETEALETAIEIVTYNEDVVGLIDRWEKLKELRETYPSER